MTNPEKLLLGAGAVGPSEPSEKNFVIGTMGHPMEMLPRPSRDTSGLQLLQERALQMSRVASSCSLLLLICLLFGCTCSDEVVSEVTSPDAVLTATSFIRNCGATTGFNSMVTVHLTTEKFQKDLDIYFSVKGRHDDLSVKWTGPAQLAVSCTSCAPSDVGVQVTKKGGVDVTFALASAP